MDRYLSFYRTAGIFSLAGFLLLGVSLLQPCSFTDNSYAESKNTDTTIGLTETLPLPDVSTDSIVLSLEPNANGDFASAEVTVGVSTNHVSGYTLTLSTEGTSTDLTRDSSSDYKIAALSNKTSATDFASLSSTDSFNKWGFTTDNNGDGAGQTDAGYYYAVTNKDNPTTIKVTDGPANVSDTKVTFATKGKDLAAGTYSNTVVFTTIANAIPTPITNGAYMHETTPQMCADSVEFDPDNALNTEYEVVDARTNEKYWVRKFGKLCWMVENLYLPAGTTISTANNYSKVNFSAYPTTQNTGGWAKVANGAMIANGSRYRTTGSGNSDGTWMNWYTATAGTGGDFNTDKAATSDICPTNWRLPTNSENGSMSVSSIGGSINNFYTTSTGATTSPIRPGYYYNDGLRNAGTYTFWWSSTQDDTYNAYTLYEYSSSLGTRSSVKYDGTSVRCVLPAE